MFRLDYLSCAFTILSTVLVSRRLWHGWAVAAANSIIICIIGIRTAQFGFIPANIFCLALYFHAIYKWKGAAGKTSSPAEEVPHTRRRRATASRFRRQAAAAKNARTAQATR